MLNVFRWSSIPSIFSIMVAAQGGGCAWPKVGGCAWPKVGVCAWHKVGEGRVQWRNNLRIDKH